MPVDVSQWMSPTCVIDGSALSSRSTSCGVVGDVLGRLERRDPAAHHLREPGEPRAVGAVDQHQHVAVARDERVDRRLDRERAAALHRDADVRVVAVNDVEQLAPHLGGDRIEVRVPRSPVAQHRGLRGERRRDGARREQDRIAGEEAHGSPVRWSRLPAPAAGSAYCRLLTIYINPGPIRKMLKTNVSGGHGAARALSRKTPTHRAADPAAPAGNGADAIALVQSSSLPMLVQQELERIILSGGLPAGSKLNEAAIAQRLGVSRGPVREAFRALEESGLVRLEKNRGVFVRQIPVEEADEIYELRAVLDEFVGRRLAQTATPGQVRELAARVDRMERAATTRRRRRLSCRQCRFSRPDGRARGQCQAAGHVSPARQRAAPLPPRDAGPGRRASGFHARASRHRRPDRARVSRPPPAARCTTT